MTRLGLVYDLRLPGMSPARRAEQYRVCLEQAAWADRHGIGRISLREHHGTPDGYLPSPLVLAGGIAARTENVTILLQALVVTLHNPLRLAEDLAVLDLMSAGRLVVMAGAGYDPNEHAMFDKPFNRRPSEMVRTLRLIRRAWRGEPVTVGGRDVVVTPRPMQEPGPPLLLGGASPAAARRAARIADGFLPVRDRFYDEYRGAVVELGRPDPGPLPQSGPFFLYVAEDPDAAWAEIGPYCLHESNAYGALARAAGLNTGFREFTDLDALRASGEYPIMTPQQAIELCRTLGDDGRLTIPPLVGGMPPELSWRSLELIAAQVLPHIDLAPSRPADYRVSVPEEEHDHAG
jgi:alkanesulfonate monooxygenase SsuD/methylene tetrahydromethanopterin reductase-like flavin-dependent oxidoreductase (luciferase family)